MFPCDVGLSFIGIFGGVSVREGLVGVGGLGIVQLEGKRGGVCYMVVVVEVKMCVMRGESTCNHHG